MAVTQHLWAMATDPAWHSAIAAWAIFVVTAIAAGYGVPAALAAAKTFRLESEPVILVRQLGREETPPHDPARLLNDFVVDGTPLLRDGVTLREGRDSDSTHPNMQASLNKSVVFELHNAGRSPALLVEIPFKVTVPTFLPERDADNMTPEVGTQHGSGLITLPGIGAGESVYVLLQNLSGNEATLTAEEVGHYVRIEDRGRKASDLAVVAVRPFHLHA